MNFQILFLLLWTTTLHASKSKRRIKEKYAKLPEIYSYQETINTNEAETEIKGDGFIKEPEDSLESYVSIAVSEAEHLEWKNLPESEIPRGNNADLTAEYTTINVPLFYGMDAEKYGIENESDKRSYFSIYLRKYHWGELNRHEPVKHVILVAGGPGESGHSWIRKIHKLSRQYGRSNLIFYVADHRGVYKSRDVFELIRRETSKGGKSRTSWKMVRRNENVEEQNWLVRGPDFEKDIGYPLVAMSCSNAARDLALISLVIHNKLLINPRDKYYLHAQSYGTQVSIRTLNLLPEFYDGVLLEGLATMELVKESAKSDFGILSSCAEDPNCSQMFWKPSVARGQLPLSSPFDLRNLLEKMTHRSHNQVCRDIFRRQMGLYVYSESVSFWDAVHLSFYEVLSDDFINPYTSKREDFYPGMLVLPIIRDMYYCEDTERFRRQVNKFIEIIAMSVRGLKQPYVKTPAKSKPVDAKQQSSYFVQTYINAHEAFDMRGMSRASERGYCDRPEQGDLVNQCPIWKEQVRKMDILRRLSSEGKLASNRGKNKKKFTDTRREKLDRFEGKYRNEGGKGYDSPSSLSSLSSLSSSTSSSDNESDGDTSDSGTFYKSAILKLFDDKKKKKDTKKIIRNRDRKGKKNFKSSDAVNHDFPNVSKSPKSKISLKRFYYDLDELAYEAPSSSKTKIIVTVGSLDIKTPILEARRLLARVQAPSKTLFELKNVGHSTDPCRGEIVSALLSEKGEAFAAAMAVADECVIELGRTKKLDWNLQGVRNIAREDWIN